jgi:hypothetical protein
VLGLLPVRTSRADVVRLSTVVAAVDPSIIDDADDGYRIGQRWVNSLTLATWTLVDATPGAAVWAQEDGGGGSVPGALGGDLGGTTAVGYVKVVRGVSGTLTYTGDRLTGVSTALGTKTLSYNPDGTLAAIAGTGNYRSKAFAYTDGRLTGVTVS